MRKVFLVDHFRLSRMLLYSIVLIPFLSGNLSAQISQGGTPLSFTSLKSFSNIPLEIMPTINVSSLLEEDIYLDRQVDYPFRFSSNFKVSLSIENSGHWYEAPDGRIWQLGIKSTDAISLHLIFNKYKLSI